MSLNNSVGITTSYGLDSWGSIPGRSKFFSLLHKLKKDSATHPISYPIDTGDLSTEDKEAGA
jgi:hypothetical protein